MHGRGCHLALLGTMLALGCGEAHTAVPPPAPRPMAELAAHFDPATVGRIEGQVTWAGELPVVPPLRIQVNPFGGPALAVPQDWPHPLAPAIDPSTRGVANAVVSLRGVDLGRSRPWDLAPVRVEQRDRQLQVVQGEQVGRLGFVRRGAAVELVSRDDVFHALHASGAAFFTLPFPDADSPLSRTLPDCGVVEMTSGVGYYWMRAHLFVTEHPYITRTDGQGRFTLAGVPPGEYELVCWLPHWKAVRSDRDPETAVVNRLYFAAPVERVQGVAVQPAGMARVEVRWTLGDFP